MYNRTEQENEDDGSGAEAVIWAIIFIATVSFIPFYLYARFVLKGSKTDSIHFSLLWSLLGVPMMMGLYLLSYMGGIMTHGLLVDPEAGSTAGYFGAWEFWVGFLWVFGGISFVYNYIMCEQAVDCGIERTTYWLAAGWSALLIVGLIQLFGYIKSVDPYFQEQQLRQQERQIAERVERERETPEPTPPEPPGPIEVTVMTGSGLESHLWNSQYQFLTDHRRLTLSTGEVVWDEAYVWITADYNSLVEGSIMLLSSESGRGVEVYYQGISITMMGRRTINWSQNGHREVR